MLGHFVDASMHKITEHLFDEHKVQVYIVEISSQWYKLQFKTETSFNPHNTYDLF